MLCGERMRTVNLKLTEQSKNRPIVQEYYEPAKTMEYADFMVAVNNFSPDIEEVNIVGGDPLLVPNLSKYLSYLSKYKVNIVTPCSVPPDVLARVRKMIKGVTVLLKYPDEELHNQWNKNSKSYSYLLQTLDWCQKNKIQSTIHFEADSPNYIYLLKVLDLCKKYGSVLHLTRFLPSSPFHNNLFLPDEIWSIVCKDAQQSGLIVSYHSGLNNMQSCGAGISEMYVLPDGSVTLTSDSNMNVGNILSEEMSTLKDRLQKERLKYSKCFSCPCIIEKKRLQFPLEVIDKMFVWQTST